MMALLRSRKLLYVLVGLVVVGLVVSGAIGLFQSFNSPPVVSPGNGQGAQGQPGPGQQGAQPPPDVDALGSPPPGFTYVDEDEAQCAQGQCFRLVTIGGEDGEELDGDPREAVRAVYEHLTDHGWNPVLPPGTESSDDVPLVDTVLTDETTLVADSTADDSDAVPVLMLGNASPSAD
ncbi:MULTISPECIES: hypothetical protein [unclassified Nocardiopsis]|uniref:hypothetical protein n=1 Tax=unclassified Nocardiopsis TaxID=2649073 RepID=UPI0033E896C6